MTGVVSTNALFKRLSCIRQMQPRIPRPSVNRAPSRPWFWRFMLVLGVALAIDFFVDDKLIFAGLTLIWILACVFTLSRLRKSRHVP